MFYSAGVSGKERTFAEDLLEDVGQREVEEVHGHGLAPPCLRRGGGLGFLLSLQKGNGEKAVEGSGELEMERREREGGCPVMCKRREGEWMLQVGDAMGGRHVPPPL